MVTETINLKKAKAFYDVTFYSFIFSSIGHAVARVAELEGTMALLVSYLPALFGFVAAPVGLFYIIKSYLQQENNDKQKKIYLIGIILANIITVVIVLLAIIVGPEIITL